MKFILQFLGNAAAILISSWLINGVSFTGTVPLLVMTAVLGIVNTLIRPLVRLISLPITIITLGIFNVVINAAMIGLAAFFVPGFSIDGIFTALLFSIVLSIVSTMIGWFTK